MGSTFFETFAEFQISARENHRMPSSASMNLQGTLFRCRCVVSESHALIARANEILEKDQTLWRRAFRRS